MSLNKYIYLRHILRSVLKEEADQNSIIDAITKKNKVMISYDDGSNGPRRILPVAYGKTSSGNLVVRAYQEEGGTETSIPGWKLFRTDKILNWNPVKDEHFSRPPEMATDNDDETMSEVYVTADFGGEQDTTETVQPVNTNVNRDTNIAGIDRVNDTRDNTGSINDMSYVSKSTTDIKSTQTVGPVTKNNLEDNAENNTNTEPDYSKAYSNGPLTKEKYNMMTSDNNTDNIDNMSFADDDELGIPVDEFKDDEEEEEKNLENEQ